jgi:HSP90 family molecular chaperone
MREQGTISIHTENIFPIIKKSLYSDHEVFLRELISNAVDAIQKLKMVYRRTRNSNCYRQRSQNSVHLRQRYRDDGGGSQEIYQPSGFL